MGARVWKRDVDVAAMNVRCASTMVDHLGIVITEVGDDYVCGTMPVDERTIQPLGLLHGGATAALIETLGSVAGAWAVDEALLRRVEINANHIRSARSGHVKGTATAVNAGRRIQVWHVEVVDDSGRLVSTGRLTLAVLPVTR